MKILIVHEVNYLSKIIYEFQILPEILSLLGHQITIIDYDDTWQSAPDTSRFRVRTQVHTNIARAYPGANVTVRRPGLIRIPLISRISGSATATLEVLRVLRNAKPDVILLYGLPTVGLQTLVAARQFHVPVVFRAIDISHELVPHRLLTFPTKALEGIVFNGVDLNVVLTPYVRDYVHSYGVPDSSIRLLPSGVDTRLFSPGPRNLELLARWGIGPDDPVVLFMGTLYRFSGLDTVIQGLARHPTVKLLIAGGGEDEARLRSLATPNVVFTGTLPYSLLPDLIRSSDVCINPFQLNGITEKILPTKLFQYMACGKPVVATSLPGMRAFLSGEQHGIIYTTLENFVDPLIDLLSDPARRELLGARGHQVAQSYDWKAIAQTLASWLAEMN